MKLSWLVIIMAMILPLGLMAQNLNNSTIPKKKEKTIGTPSQTFKKVAEPKKAVSTTSIQKKELTKSDKLFRKSSDQPRVIQKAPAPTMTLAEKREAALAKTPQGQRNLKMGLPASASEEEYKLAKEKLYNESPSEYNKLFSPKKNSQPSVRKVSRLRYNSLPKERQLYIKQHPELYQIVD